MVHAEYEDDVRHCALDDNCETVAYLQWHFSLSVDTLSHSLSVVRSEAVESLHFCTNFTVMFIFL